MKHLMPALIFVLLTAACSDKAARTDSSIDAQVDSIVGSRIEEVNRKAMEDLDQRTAIEVKAKADSIIAARQAALADTVTAQ